MITVINPGETIASKQHPSGTWPFMLLFPNGLALASDTITELVGTVLEEYPADDDPETALEKRHAALIEIATEAQSRLIGGATDDGFDLTSLTEDELNAALADKDLAIQFDGEWDTEFPLVVVASMYEPYTDVPLPTGEVVVLDPLNERTFIDALVALGIAELHVGHQA